VADDRDTGDGDVAFPPDDEAESPAADARDGEAAGCSDAVEDETALSQGDEPEAQVTASGDGCSFDDTDAASPPRSGVRLAVVFGVVCVLALTGAGSWLGWQVYQAHQVQVQRDVFLQTGRQAALNLTTIDYNQAEANVQRILDSATGTFYDDFQRRSPAFVNVVQQARSKSEGTITSAGLESQLGDQAQVLVAVTVKTSNAAAADQPPRAWRMRLNVQRVGEGVKVSNVEFVP
jgi:Mce-associated membrane protein